MVKVEYGLNEFFQERLESQILESISFKVDMDEFSNEKYRERALKACMDYVDDSLEEGRSLKSISHEIESRNPEDTEILAKKANIDINSEELAKVYKEAYDEVSVDAEDVERSHHEKAIHHLIEQSLESNNFEKDFDAVFSETFFSDHTYQNKAEEYPDIELNQHRNLDEIIASDADFWRVNLENEEIDLVEVKSSDKGSKNSDNGIEGEEVSKPIEEIDQDFSPTMTQNPESRRERQVKQFKEAVNYANNQVGTSFDVNYEIVIAREMLDSEDEPGFYTGDYKLSEDVDPKNLETLESFVDELLFDISMHEADQIESVSPEEWVETA